MDNIMDFLPIIIIVFMVLFLIGKLKGNSVTNTASENGYRTSDEIYMQWKKDSVAAKIKFVFLLIFYFGITLLMLYLSFGDDLGLEPLEKIFDFENKNDEEICTFLTNVLKYFLGFLGVIVAGGLLLDTYSVFDMAKWLSRNEVDCYPILKNGNGNKTFNFQIGNGFLIKERPSTKYIFYIRIGALVVIDELMIMSISKFCKSLFTQTYEAFEVYGMEPGEWAKSVFTSSDAIFCYVAFVAALSLISVFNRILRNKQAELLNSVPQNIDEE